MCCLDQFLNVQLGAKTHFTVRQVPAHLPDLYVSTCCCCCCLPHCANSCAEKSLKDVSRHFFISLLSSTPSSSHIMRLDYTIATAVPHPRQHDDPITKSGKHTNVPAPATAHFHPAKAAIISQLINRLSNRFN